MSELHYGPVRPACATWRYVVVGVVTVLATPASLVAAFAAAVTWSGCFLECGTPNRGGGAVIGLVALALLSAGPLLAWLLLRRWAAVAWTVGGVVAVVVLVLLTMI